MKKRLFGTILAAALIVSQAVSAFAAVSKTGELEIAGDSVGWYELREVTEENMPELAQSAPEVVEKVMDINSGAATLQSISDLAPDLADDLDGFIMLSRFYGLIPVNGGVPTEDGKYIVSLSVPGLSGNVKDVRLIYYNTSRNAWEIINPVSVDYANKVITIILEDLFTPVAVIGKLSAGADAEIGTSPKTGTSYAWAAWLGAGILLAAAGTAAYKKSK